MKFQPKLIPTLIFVPTLLLLIFLGTWQLYRLQWKNNLITELKSKQAMAIAEFSAKDPKNQDLEYRKVKVKGHFLHDKEIHVYGGNRGGVKDQGVYFILTPFQLENGGFLLVNRGWVPSKQKLASSRSETLITGEIEIEGTLLPSEKSPSFILKHEPANNIWFWVDIPAIKAYTKLELFPYFLLQSKTSSSLPVGREIDITNIRNDHLGYAITWFAAALSLIIIYVLYHLRLMKTKLVNRD
jgi:surfeit locus 1 family protein